MSKYDYDLVVIGAGIAGMAAAVTASGLGKKVAIIERRSFGGNCSTYTCLPSKALIRSGHIKSLSTSLDKYGLSSNHDVQIGTEGVMSQIRSIVRDTSTKDTPETFGRIGIQAIEGQAEFIDNHHVTVNRATISGDKFIIATGTRPLVPPINGLDKIEYLTNETLYDLNTLPESMLILGGGIDGLEFASALCNLGVKVTIVEMAPRLLASIDRELANLLLSQLRRAGITIHDGTKAVSLAEAGGKITLQVENPGGDTTELAADCLLLTIGRKANLDGLGLEQAKVQFTPKGITTNSKLQTSTPNIFACGDIVGPYQLASMAEYQGILAATNAFLPYKKKVDYSAAAFVMFTEPPLAYLGLTEEQARQKHGDNITVYRFEYGRMRRALVDRSEEGIAKFICDSRGRLLGAHILGEAAPEVIHEAQLIKAFNKPLYQLNSITHAYPTYAQALIGRAGQLAYLDRMAVNFFVKQFLRFMPGYENRLTLARQRLAEDVDISQRESAEKTTSYITVKAREPYGKEVGLNAVKLGDTAYVIELPSELTHEDESPYLEACAADLPGKNPNIVLDFSAVHSINGLGASMLAKLYNLARRRGQRLLAANLREHYHDVFKVTGLDLVIPTYPDRKAALFAAGLRGEISLATGSVAKPLDIAYWAKPVTSLKVPEMPPEAINLNMKGRRVVGPIEGFGQLWQKKYHLHVKKPTKTPEEIITILKNNLPAFQPSYNHFYPTPAGIRTGEVVLIDSSTVGGPVSTGVMVLYADDRSFTLITPQGHPESGWVTFSAFDTEDEVIVQILGLARANDPVYEAAFKVVGAEMQVRIWRHVLTSLATFLGVPADVTVEPRLVDRKIQWSHIKNLWYNAQIRTLLYMPVRLIFKRKGIRR